MESTSTVSNGSTTSSDPLIAVRLSDGKIRVTPSSLACKCVLIKLAVDEANDNGAPISQSAVAHIQSVLSDYNSSITPDSLVPTTAEYSINADSLIELSEINSERYDLLIKFVAFYESTPYEELPKPIPKEITVEDFLDLDYYKEFCKWGEDEIQDLFNTAMYMDYKPLKVLTGAIIAKMMQPKKIEQIREMFGIKFDFEPEEYKKIEEECEAIFT
jgi:hypothetical protein